MIKVISVFGTRPEAIKMAPLVKALEKNPKIHSIVVVTAQHREMLDQVLKLFDIKPDYDLNIMSHGQTVLGILSKAMSGLDEIFKEEKPNIVLVHGDTTTTLAGAQAAFLNQIPVGHVEAGLRSGNIYSPFPEEMNRKQTTAIATLHFAPTQGNYDHLKAENVKTEAIYITGNTVIDALIDVIEPSYHFEQSILNHIDYTHKKVILLTCHRRENWGKPMEDIFNSMVDIVKANAEVEIIFPMHMNPNIRQLAKQIMGQYPAIHLIEPLEYQPFTNLMNKVYLVMTDSGGIQEEAPALGKPVLVLRTETERPEAVDAGTVKVVGVDRQIIFEAAQSLLNDSAAYDAMSNAVNPYGDGKSCQRIVEAIVEVFENK